MKRFFLGFLLVFVFNTASAEPLKGLLVYVPQTDESASSWIKFMDRHPDVRMVIALSPRFHRLNKDAAQKDRLIQFRNEGRLAFALQIPNAPPLALLDDTNVARTALPAGAPLPEPAYSASDDALQHIAQAKSSFVSQWNVSSTGLIVPYGAVSPGLLRTLGRTGIDWAVAALGLSGGTSGAWKLDSFLGWNSVPLWDGTPVLDPTAGLRIHVWDEREMKSSGKAFDMLERWVKEFSNLGVVYILPTDPGLPEPQKLPENAFHLRTWTQDYWSDWIGVPEKNAVWGQLRRTREAIENYKNSGAANIPRLDAAMAEFYTAQNSNYFIVAGNDRFSDAERQDRAQEFQGTLNNIFRLINKPVPDDLFSMLAESQRSVGLSSMTVVTLETVAEGTERFRYTRESGALRGVEVVVSSQTLTWSVTWSSPIVGSNVDVYVDINAVTNLGTTIALPRGTLGINPEDAWEYAFRVMGDKATFYRTQSGSSFTGSSVFPVEGTGSRLQWTMPRAQLRGNPRRWGLQAQVLSADGTLNAKLTESRFVHYRATRP